MKIKEVVEDLGLFTRVYMASSRQLEGIFCRSYYIPIMCIDDIYIKVSLNFGRSTFYMYIYRKNSLTYYYKNLNVYTFPMAVIKVKQYLRPQKL
jgi:hypothetical protein